jgi:hypothetical protein
MKYKCYPEWFVLIMSGIAGWQVGDWVYHLYNQIVWNKKYY